MDIMKALTYACLIILLIVPSCRAPLSLTLDDLILDKNIRTAIRESFQAYDYTLLLFGMDCKSAHGLAQLASDFSLIEQVTIAIYILCAENCPYRNKPQAAAHLTTINHVTHRPELDLNKFTKNNYTLFGALFSDSPLVASFLRNNGDTEISKPLFLSALYKSVGSYNSAEEAIRSSGNSADSHAKILAESIISHQKITERIVVFMQNPRLQCESGRGLVIGASEYLSKRSRLSACLVFFDLTQDDIEALKQNLDDRVSFYNVRSIDYQQQIDELALWNLQTKPNFIVSVAGGQADSLTYLFSCNEFFFALETY